jgi:hypothetical protein
LLADQTARVPAVAVSPVAVWPEFRDVGKPLLGFSIRSRSMLEVAWLVRLSLNVADTCVAELLAPRGLDWLTPAKTRAWTTQTDAFEAVVKLTIRLFIPERLGWAR